MASKVAIQRSSVVIIGAGFGGLSAAKALTGGPFNVTLVDRYNYHLFQPLLYQVATAALSPADIAWPIRTVFRRQLNVSIVLVCTFELPLDLAPRSQRKTPPGERRGFRNLTGRVESGARDKRGDDDLSTGAAKVPCRQAAAARARKYRALQR